MPRQPRRTVHQLIPFIALAVAMVVAAATWGGLASASGAPSLIGFGYQVDYDPQSRVSLAAYGNRLHAIITTNFTFADTSGRLQGTTDPGILQLARSRGLRVHFRLSNDPRGAFDRAIAHAVLVQPETRARALAAILQVLDGQGYDGVSIDLENVPPADRTALTAFMRDLTAAVHAKGKTVSIAVPAKTADDPGNDWNGAFDYAALAGVSDWLVIMAYDEHWSTSAPGPVASLSWVAAVARYAAGRVPAQKLLLGIAFYGYDWPVQGPAEGISMREAISRAARAGVDIQWDDRAQVPFFRALGRTVYFENAQSVKQKLQIAVSAGLAGVAIWRLGHELPDVWETMDAYLSRASASH